MSCVVMYQPYPTSSPYFVPSGQGSSAVSSATSSASPSSLPPLSGFEARIPSTQALASSGGHSAVSPPVNSPHSPAQQQQHAHSQQRLQLSSNGLSCIEPKIEKNLDTTGGSCDAYGQLLAASGRTSASGASEANNGSSPNSRPNSAHHIHHRRDSDQDKDNSDQATAVGSAGDYNMGQHPLIIPSYNGAATTAVDEHFEKALRRKNESNYNGGDKAGLPPMKERNLPTSFWKPQFNNGSASSSGHHGNHSYETYSDQLQQHAAMLNHLIPADWQYSPNLQSAAAGTAGYSRTAAAAAGHYNYSQFHAAHQPASAAGQYWAAASRLAASQAIKGEWGSGDYQASALSTAASLHTPSASEFAAAAHHPYVGTAAMHHYSNMTGLDTSSMQDPSKELYWAGAGF